MSIAGQLLLSLPAMPPALPYFLKTPLVALVAVFFCLGLLTPITCAINALLLFTVLVPFTCTTSIGASLHIALTVSLFLLVPGAYSVDARRYGRRIVVQSGF